MVAHLYPYLKIPTDAFKSNLRTLLVQVLHRALVAPLAQDKGVKNAKAQAKENEKLHVEERQIALRWNYAACAILMRIDRGDLSGESAKMTARNLIEKSPSRPTYTSKQLQKVLLNFVNDITNDWDFVRCVISCATIKRSGCFAGHKKRQTVEALARAKVHFCEKLNMKLPGDLVVFDDSTAAAPHLLFCGKIGTQEKGDERFVYKNPSGTATMRVQNEKSYENKDICGMKGDAELKRVPWRIDGPSIPDGISNEDFMRSMLSGLVPFVPKVTAEKLMVVATMPNHVAVNDTLATLWKEADALTSSSLSKIMPLTCLRTLFQVHQF